MDKSEKKKRTVHSMLEFERKYFPKSVGKKITEKPSDERTLGISLADESLVKIAKQLSR